MLFFPFLVTAAPRLGRGFDVFFFFAPPQRNSSIFLFAFVCISGVSVLMFSFPVMSDETVVRRNNPVSYASQRPCTTYEASQLPGHQAAHHSLYAGSNGPREQYHRDPSLESRDGMTSTAMSAGYRDNRGGGDDGEVAGPPSSSPSLNPMQLIPPLSILCVGPPPPTFRIEARVAPPEMARLSQLAAAAMMYRCSVSSPESTAAVSQFHSSSIPGISIWDYMRRISKYFICTPACFVVALILLDRYVEQTRMPVTLRNIHRLCITCATLSVKVADDGYYSNKYYASIGGVDTAELNSLELELLHQIKWSTWISRPLYDAYIEVLEKFFGCFLPPSQFPEQPVEDVAVSYRINAGTSCS